MASPGRAASSRIETSATSVPPRSPRLSAGATRWMRRSRCSAWIASPSVGARRRSSRRAGQVATHGLAVSAGVPRDRRHRPASPRQGVDLHIVLLSQHPPGASIQIAGVENQRPWRGPPTDRARGNSLRSALRAFAPRATATRTSGVGNSRDHMVGRISRSAARTPVAVVPPAGRRRSSERPADGEMPPPTGDWALCPRDSGLPESLGGRPQR